MKFGEAVKNAMKSWKLALLAGGVTYGVAWLINYFKVQPIQITASVIDVRTQVVNQGIAGNFGDKILGLPFVDFLSAQIPAGFAGLAGLLVGAFAITFLGSILVNLGLPKLPFGNEAFKKVSSTLLYGSLLGAIIIGMVTSIGVWTTLVAMAIYYIVIAVIIALLFNMKPIEKFASQ
jgi:hypothetical protein